MAKYIVWINANLKSDFELFQNYGDEYIIIGDGERKLKEKDFVFSKEIMDQITSKTQFIYLSHGGLDKEEQVCTYGIETGVLGKATELDLTAAADEECGFRKLVIAPGAKISGVLNIAGVEFDFRQLQEENYTGPGTRTQKDAYVQKEASDHEIYSLIFKAIKSSGKSDHPTIHISSCYGGTSFAREDSALKTIIAQELPNARLVVYAGNQSVLIRKDKVIFDILNQQVDLLDPIALAQYIEKVSVEVPESICAVINGKKILFERPNDLMLWNYKEAYIKLHTDLECAIGAEYASHTVPDRPILLEKAFDYYIFQDFEALRLMFEQDSKLGLPNAKYFNVLGKIFSEVRLNIYNKDGGFHEIAELVLGQVRKLSSDGSFLRQDIFDHINVALSQCIWSYSSFESFGMTHIIDGLLDEAIKVNGYGVFSIQTKTQNLVKLINVLGYEGHASHLIDKIIEAGIIAMNECRLYAPSLVKDAALQLSKSLDYKDFKKEDIIFARCKLVHNKLIETEQLALLPEKLLELQWGATGHIIPDIKLNGENYEDLTHELPIV